MNPNPGFLVIAALVLAGGVGATAQATPVLDQSYTASTGAASAITDGTGFQRAMTFTVRISGDLTSVEVGVTGGTLDLDILSTSGGVPTETALGTGTFDSAAGGFSTFTTALSVTAGEVLALEPVCATGPCGPWATNIPNTYVGGQSFLVSPSTGFDTFTSDLAAAGTSRGLDFQTFVNPSAASVPEPLTLSLFGVGLAGLAATRRRRKRAQA